MDNVQAQRDADILAAIRGRAAGLRLTAASTALLVFSFGTVLSVVVQRHLLEVTPTAQHLVELNVGEAFALAAIVSLLVGDPREWAPSQGSDVAVLLLSALAWFVPEQHGVYLSTTIAGIWFLVKRRSDRRLRDLSQIWIALSIYELWGKLIFKLAYQSIEVLEVGLLFKIGRLFYGGLGVDGASLRIRGDWSIVILEGCSSFHNLSLTVLVWLSILKIAGQPAGAAAFHALGISACLVVAINVTRILAMLPSPEAFAFWHDGVGSSAVALSSVAAAILPILLCVEGGTCRRSPRT